MNIAAVTKHVLHTPPGAAIPLAIAKVRGCRAADFGLNFYLACIKENRTYSDDDDWQAELTLEDKSKVKEVRLYQNRNVYFLAPELFSRTSYSNQPQAACYAICQGLGPEGCGFFTYDGFTKDRRGFKLAQEHMRSVCAYARVC